MSKANIDDIFGASPKTSSSSTNGPNGMQKSTKNSTSGSKKKKRRAEPGQAESSLTLVKPHSDKPSGKESSENGPKKKGQKKADGWERWLEAELEEPMHMSLHEAAMKVEELSMIPWASQTRLQRVEFSTAMRILREAREKKRAEERTRNFVPNTEEKAASLGTAGRSAASGPSPSAKLGGATRTGKPALDEEAPNRRIDYLAEVEASGRSMAALAIDSKFAQPDKELLAILRNHRLRGISPNRRTPAQEEEITLATSIINEGRERAGVGPYIENPGKVLLPSTAKGLQEAPPAPPKKAKVNVDDLFVDIDSLFDDVEEDKGQELPPNLRETPTWKVNPAMLIIHEAFGPEPEGYERWRTAHLKLDGITENKEKRAWREANKDFDPFKPEEFAARYNFEKKIIKDREAKGADLKHPATKAELVQIGKDIAARIGKGPLTGAEATDKKTAPTAKKQKARNASGQGEKAAAAIAVAGQDEEVINEGPKYSDDLSEEAWDLAMNEALEAPESQAQEVDYSPTYRAMLATMRWAMTSNTPPDITDNREELLYRYALHNDMSQQASERRAEIIGRVMKYYARHTVEADGKTPKVGLALDAGHYRVIMAAKVLAGLVEDYATLPLKKGQTEATDESLTNLCKQATVRYIEAHREIVSERPEPSYLEYKRIIAKLGRKEGYLLTPEDLAQAG